MRLPRLLPPILAVVVLATGCTSEAAQTSTPATTVSDTSTSTTVEPAAATTEFSSSAPSKNVETPTADTGATTESPTTSAPVPTTIPSTTSSTQPPATSSTTTTQTPTTTTSATTTTSTTAAPVITAPPPSTPAQAYFAACAGCHAADLSGDFGPALNASGNVPNTSDAEVTAVIVSGRGRMPSFGERFDAAEIAALVVFIRANM